MARNHKACPIAVGHARQLLKELRIRHVDELNVELIAMHCGFVVRKQPMKNAEGRLLASGSAGIIAVAETAYATSKWRFVIAHELGHSKRHKKLNQLDICSDADLRAAYAGREAEANDFASELLMPAEFFKPSCDLNRPSLREMRDLAHVFGTSLTATAIRFVDFTTEPCAVVHSTAGKVDWVARSESFRLFIPHQHVLTETSHAGDLHRNKPALDYLQQVDGSAWSDSPRADAMDLFEHSIKVAPTAVLTMLWHPYSS